MIVDRIFTPSLAQVTYLVADEATGDVAVIDPRRDVQACFDWATERGFQITSILETHVHADFVSGGRELSALTGVPVSASRLGNQDFPHQPLDDGDIIPVGSLKLQAYFTPGHTPEHMSYLLFDPAQGEEPLALFSGDALFVGDVGRPDLLGASHTSDLANQLYATVTERFLTLPDSVIVYPGHTAGSSCGKMIGDAPDTTIGAEKAGNYAFKPMDRDTFVATVLDNMPKAPTYYPELKKVNKVGPALATTLTTGTPLTASSVAAMQHEGALVIDTRSPAAFNAGHIPGALAVGWGPNFLTWIGWIAPYDRSLILVLDDDATYTEAVTELRRIGVDRVAGFLQGGMSTWTTANLPTVSLTPITVTDLADRLRAGAADLAVLDVRRPDEWETGHIAGAEHHFVGNITQGDLPNIDDTLTTAVICGTGYRSTVAASILQQHGHTNLLNVTGGMTAWHDADLPVAQ